MNKIAIFPLIHDEPLFLDNTPPVRIEPVFFEVY